MELKNFEQLYCFIPKLKKQNKLGIRSSVLPLTLPNFYKGSHKNKATLFTLIPGHILEICNSSVCKKHHCCSRGNSSSGAAEKMWPDVEIIIHCVGQKRAFFPLLGQCDGEPA